MSGLPPQPVQGSDSEQDEFITNGNPDSLLPLELITTHCPADFLIMALFMVLFTVIFFSYSWEPFSVPIHSYSPFASANVNPLTVKLVTPVGGATTPHPPLNVGLESPNQFLQGSVLLIADKLYEKSMLIGDGRPISHLVSVH